MQCTTHCMQHAGCLIGQAVMTADRYMRLLHPRKWKVVKQAIAAASPAQDSFARAPNQFDPGRPFMPGRAGAALLLKKEEGDDEARPDRFSGSSSRTVKSKDRSSTGSTVLQT